MAWINLGELLKIEHDTLKSDHQGATLATTRLHMDADDAEDRGEHRNAADLRAVADEIQVSANKRWYRSN